MAINQAEFGGGETGFRGGEGFAERGDGGVLLRTVF